MNQKKIKFFVYIFQTNSPLPSIFTPRKRMASSENAQYVLILEVQTPPDTGNAHMTIAFMGNRKPEFSHEDRSAFELCLKGARALIVGEDKFGPKNDIPVWLVSVEAISKEINGYILQLWNAFNVEQPHTVGLTAPSLHITKKGAAANFKLNDTVVFSRMSAKQIGSEHKPYFTVDLV